MSEAMALCTAVRVLGHVALTMYRAHFNHSDGDRPNKKGSSRRRPSGMSENQQLSDKKANKGDEEAPKSLTKRAAHKVRAFAGSHKKKQLIADNLKLQHENEVLEAQLLAEQRSKKDEHLRLVKETANRLDAEQEISTLKRRLDEEQEDVRSHQRQLKAQSTAIIKLNEANAALDERLHLDHQAALAEQRRSAEEAATLEAEKKTLSDELDRANALASAKQQELHELREERNNFQVQLEEATRRVVVAEKSAAQQMMETDQAERRIDEAEAHIKALTEKLANAESLTKGAQDEAENTGKELYEAKSKITQLHTNLQDEEESSKCLGEENEKLEAKVAESQDSIDRLRAALDSKEDEAGHSDAIKTLNELNTKLQKQVEDMKTEIANLKTSLDISEGEALQAMSDVDTERAEKDKLAEQLKHAKEQTQQPSTVSNDTSAIELLTGAKQEETITIHADEINCISDIEELREKLLETLQQAQDTQRALQEANGRSSCDSLVKLNNSIQINKLSSDVSERDEYIDNIQAALGQRDWQLNELKARLERVLKLVTKNMVDWTEHGVEDDVMLRERTQKKNMQQQIPSCDYLYWEFSEMRCIANNVEITY